MIDLILYNIGQLVTSRELDDSKRMDNIEVLENAYIVIEKDRIVAVGEGEVPKEYLVPTAEMVDLKGKLVSPGLIDSHTHLVHGGSRENEFAMKIEGVPYLDILAAGGGILSSLTATRKATHQELIDKTLRSLKYMLELGVTTVEAKSGYGLNLESELKQLEVTQMLGYLHPITLVSTFMAAHAVPPEYKENREAYIEEIIRMLPIVKERNLAEFCDIFCEDKVFSVEESRKILLAAKELGFKLKIHADEIVSLGGVELSVEVGATSVEHLMKITDDGIKNLANSNVIADLLPATSFNLMEHYAPAKKMIEAGIQVALSTDYNPGSCPSENLQFVMQIGAAHLKMTPKEVFKSVTLNAARAIDKAHEIGSIEVGKKADISVFDVPSMSYFLYHFGANHTDRVYKNGKLVFKRQ